MVWTSRSTRNRLVAEQAAAQAERAQRAAEEAAGKAEAAAAGTGEAIRSAVEQVTAPPPSASRGSRLAVLIGVESVLLLLVCSTAFIDVGRFATDAGQVDVAALSSFLGAGCAALGAALAMLVEVDPVKRFFSGGPQNSLLVLPFLFLAVGAGLMWVAELL